MEVSLASINCKGIYTYVLYMMCHRPVAGGGGVGRSKLGVLQAHHQLSDRGGGVNRYPFFNYLTKTETDVRQTQHGQSVSAME